MTSNNAPPGTTTDNRSTRCSDPASGTTAPALQFFAPGEPVAQGSKKPIGNGKFVESDPKLHGWRRKVNSLALAAAPEGFETITTPVLVAATFVMPRPKYLAKVHPTPRMAGRKDLDKLQRAIGDSLSPKQGFRVLANDNLIDSWFASKRYAEPNEATGVWVSVYASPVAVELSAVAS